MSSPSFFEESLVQSRVKAEIVAKYFGAWASVVIPTAKKKDNKIAYIDLFAGPGRYKDGTKSTPLLVLEQALRHPNMPEMLVSMFNDVDSDNTRSLEEEINLLSGIESFKYRPKVHNQEVGTELVKMFEDMKLVPTLFFVDPWGYKGLSLRLINSVLKNWGCDCIFFFNYNRISMGITNPNVVKHMNALFGEDRADALRYSVDGLSPFDREMFIVNELSMALKELGGKFVLPFCFKNDRGKRTSHHLVFVCKHVRGYEIMKEVMAKYSSGNIQGVPSFQYNPVVDRRFPLLFELSRPLNTLGEMLLSEFAGKTLTMREVYDNHHVDRPFIKRNYKAVLNKLEFKGLITANPPMAKRSSRNGEKTFGDAVSVSFPRK